MRPVTLLPVKGRPSDEVALTKGRPCGAGVDAEVGAFSGIGGGRRLVVFYPTRIRELENCRTGHRLGDGRYGTRIVLGHDENGLQ